MFILGGIASAVIALLILRAAPRITVVIWLVVLFFVPIWVGVQVGPFWSAATLATILAIATCSQSIELSPIDGIIAAFAVLVLVQFALGSIPLSGAFTPLSEWLLPYIWGRIVLTRVNLEFLVQAIALVATATAALAVLEWATSTNYFVQIPPGNHGAFETWSPLQARGGSLRVEGAFGHSIALGATLSMCSAFVLAARWHVIVRLSLLSVVAAAVVLSLSRIGLVTFVLTLTLVILLLPGISLASRIWTGAIGLAAAIMVIPYVSAVFLEAGNEAEGSANYRLDLLSLLQVLRPFGAVGEIAGLTVGGDYLGFFAHSIDNAFMHAALRLGWVPTLLLASALILVAVSVIRRRGANVATVAVAAQIVGLFAVAFITQYTTFFWFAVGLAVAIGTVRPHSGEAELVTSDETAQSTIDFPTTDQPVNDAPDAWKRL